ncbi:MFS-type transporter SLC18B1, partial [Armadillidium vulgare]
FCLSLLAPFYPIVAEIKGATPSQYSLVFGVASLTLFIFTPLVGIMIGRFGAVKISLCGLFLIGVTSILFGFLEKVNITSLFIGMSVLLRAFYGMGYAMVRNSGIAIVSHEFSENVEKSFALVQSFSSAGQLLGPVTGGALYELGGFILPFTVTGAIVLFTAILVLFLSKEYPNRESKLSKKILMMLRHLQVIIGVFAVFGFSTSIGIVISFLEPHLKSLHLSPFQLGSMFFCNALASSSSSFFWSIMCEKFGRSEYIVPFSALIVICGLILLGPAPYLPLDLSIYSTVSGLLIFGVGQGGLQVSAFSCINKGVHSANISQDIQSYGFISTIYTTSLALGLFVGPLIGGRLFDVIGFAWSCHIIIGYLLIGGTYFIEEIF